MGTLNPSSRQIRTCISYVVHNMTVDDLAPFVAKASAAMLLTSFPGIFRFSALHGLRLSSSTMWISILITQDRCIKSGPRISTSPQGGTTSQQLPMTSKCRYWPNQHDQRMGQYCRMNELSESQDISMDILAHWGRDKMAAIFPMTFSDIFSWMKMHEFLIIFHWNLFLRVQLTIFQHWFK